MKLTDYTEKNIEFCFKRKATLCLSELSYEFGQWERLKWLLKALEENKTVTNLDLSSCKINDAQLKTILMSLKKNASVLMLSLDNNNLTNESISSLKDFIEEKKLKHIFLTNNQFTDENVDILKESISSVGTDTNLWKENKISNKLQKTLHFFFEKENSLSENLLKEKIPPITLAKNLDEAIPEDLQKALETVSPKTRSLLESMLIEIKNKEQQSNVL